jgi:uncharacterized protein (TIGR00251 family)
MSFWHTAGVSSDEAVVAVDGGVVIRVRVKPRASKSKVLGIREGLVEVAVSAPPVDGEANDALVRAVARHFDVANRAVTILAGATSRVKRVRIEGVSAEDVRERLGRP